MPLPFITNSRLRPSGIKRGKRIFRVYRSIHTRQGLKDALDDVVSKIVRKRDDYTCITCGCTDRVQLTCSHFYPRRFLATRWNLDNLACQCLDCNVAHSTKSPWPFLKWLLNKLSEDAFHELSELRMSRFEMSNDDMRKLLDGLRCELRGMA